MKIKKTDKEFLKQTLKSHMEAIKHLIEKEMIDYGAVADINHYILSKIGDAFKGLVTKKEDKKNE